jgi:nickel-dependent lactate racemase
MLQTKATAPFGQLLTDDEVRNTVGVLEGQFANQRVLVLIPDHTRSLPLPFLFRSLVDVLHDTKQLDFMVALGTHPPLSEESLHKLVGITAEERGTTFRQIGLLNHAWDTPSALTSLGIIEQEEIKQFAGIPLCQMK